MEDQDEEREVTIKLKAWQIPHLLGAARLGIWLEDWCGALVQTEINTYDTHSGKWILRLAYIIDQIKQQTGIETEYKEYGSAKGWLEEIEKWVDGQCKENERRWRQWEEEEHKKFLADKGHQKAHKKLMKRLKPVTVKITDDVIEQAKAWARKVQEEKR